MAAGSAVRKSGRTKAGRGTPQSRSSPQSSTRLATRRQAQLPFKNPRTTSRPVKKVVVDTTKLMYRSNIAGVIKTVLEFDFGEGHIKQLRKTPFWLMFDTIRVHKLDPNTYKKCDATVCRVIQTYNPDEEKFYVGGVGLPLRNSDIRLLFGVQCGKEKLDLSHGGRPPSDFIQRRCPIVSRISSKVIKDALVVAMRGRTERDEEDVAKLMCLYVCAKLFFATTGESIGWAFVRVIDKLETIRLYDWTAAIRNTLICSLNDAYSRPERVTGCVVALLFLLCEHTGIVEPDRRNVSPRFCRWNIGKLKSVELSVEGSIEVNVDKLAATIIETYFVKMLSTTEDDVKLDGKVLEVEPVSTWDGGRSNAEARGNTEVETVNFVEPSLDCWQPDSPNGGEVELTVETNKKDIPTTPAGGIGNESGKMLAAGEAFPVLFPDLLDLSCTPPGAAVGKDTNDTTEQLKNALDRINELETEVRSKSARVRELDGKVEAVERMLGAQASNLFIGFDSVIVAKDAEIARLNTEVSKLEARIATLEDHVDDREVHEVTQSVLKEHSAPRTPSDNRSGKSSESGNVPSCDSVHRSPAVRDGVANLGDHQDGLIKCDTIPMHIDVDDFGVGRQVETVVVVDGSGLEEMGKVDVASPVPEMTSLVRRVKSKVRREFRLSEYEYPTVVGRGKKKWKMGNKDAVGPEIIYDVEDVEVQNKTWHGFGMNTKHAVWNMLEHNEIKLLERVYTFDGDGAIIWDGGESGVQVCFTDIRDLVQRSSIHGNVIDAYAAVLMELRRDDVNRAEYGDTSYIFTSVCSDVMRNPSALSRTKYLNVQTKAAKGHRYTHYPVYHANHWTVMVYDSVNGTWKHYNSAKSRRGIRDEHYNESLKLKQWLEDYYTRFVWPRLSTGSGRMPDFDKPLVSVMDCPQQSPKMSDCAIYVCYVIRQYVHGCDIGSTMDGITPLELRASIVKMFLNDAAKGLRALIR